MSELFTDTGMNPEVVKEYLGDDFYNDPATKQEATKMFDNIKDERGLLKMTATAQRKATQNEAKYAEKYKGLVKIPDEKSTQEERATYNKAVGVPDKAEGYELTIPEKSPKGELLTDIEKASFAEVANTVRAAALKGGAPAGMIKGLWGEVITVLNKQAEDMVTKGNQIIQTEIDGQKEKHKGKYDEFVKTGDDALAKFKAGGDVIKILDAFGLRNQPAIHELLAEIAPLVLEKGTIGGTGAPGGKQDDWPIDYDTMLKSQGVSKASE